MYKLFLCLKYLRRRYLALIAVAAVALCVAMVLIVVSVYDGFLSKVENAAKGLFGDVIVDSSQSLSAIGRYDQFISQLTGLYYVDADFGPANVRAGGPGSEVVFQGKTGPAAAQVLAGDAKFTKPVSVAASGSIFKDGRRIGELRGQLTIQPGRLNEEKGSLEYDVQLAGKTDLPADRLTDPAEPVRLVDVRARLGEGIPEVESATPVIYTYGLLRIGPSFTATVQISGIRLPERLEATDFAKALFVQAGQGDASFDPPLGKVVGVAADHLRRIQQIERIQQRLSPARRDPELLRKLGIARDNATLMQFRLEQAEEQNQQLTRLRTDLAGEQAKPADQRDQEKLKALAELTEKIARRQQELIGSPQERVILGLGIGGMSFRTPEGETIRWVTPGQVVKLTLLPLRRGAESTTITPSIGTFFVVDDAKTDVWTVDSSTVYVPFGRLQELADMRWRPYVDDPADGEPSLCSQIQVKVAPAFGSDRKLIEARRKIEGLWRAFERKYPDAAISEVSVQTWREKLAKFIGPVQKQRTLVTIMFGIISFVSVLLIFAIFYMIVVQKTRDIGVIRAVGGSGPGVAQIFLGFGAATGLVGSILGLIGGYYFVHYINEIEDLLARWWGFRVWERDVFLFEKIPNQVDSSVAMVIAVWAIASGLVGALIPAIRAAVMEPAEAIRYE